MRPTSAALFSLSLALCPPGAAADAATDAVVEIELSGDAFPESEPPSQGWLRIAPRVTRQLSPRVLLTVAPVFEADTHGDVDRSRLYDHDDRAPRRALLRLERLSLRFDLGAVKVEVGRQPLTWGRTDAINPTDNLTPRDWTDALREARLSPWALRVNVEKRRWDAELALVPPYAPSRLPRIGGRWAPIEPIRIANLLDTGADRPALEVRLDVAEPDYPSTTLDNVQAGLKLGRRGGRGEWAVSYYRGFDDAPHFDPSVGAPDPAAGILPVTLTPRFPRLEVVGADGVLLAGAWALRAEAGHFRFPDGRDESFLLYEVDAEWTRGAWRAVAGFADLSGQRRAPAPATALDLGFLPAAFLHLGRSLFTEWEASLDAWVGTEERDWLVRLSGSWPARDNLRLGAEIDLIDGRRGTFFGAWRRNDRLRLYARFTR